MTERKRYPWYESIPAWVSITGMLLFSAALVYMVDTRQGSPGVGLLFLAAVIFLTFMLGFRGTRRP